MSHVIIWVFCGELFPPSPVACFPVSVPVFREIELLIRGWSNQGFTSQPRDMKKLPYNEGNTKEIKRIAEINKRWMAGFKIQT